jgi:hypothetical protein
MLEVFVKRKPPRTALVALAPFILLLCLGAAALVAMKSRSKARRAERFADEQRCLNQSIPEIPLGNPPAKDAVEALERTCGVPIHVSGMTAAAAFPNGWQEFFRSRVRDLSRATIVRMPWTYPTDREFSDPQIWMTADGGIGVGAAAPRVLRVYPIGDMLDVFDRGPGGAVQTYLFGGAMPPKTRRALVAARLVRLLTEIVRPEDWPDNGGSTGHIGVLADRLMVVQTPQGHAAVRQVLAALREGSPEGAAPPPPIDGGTSLPVSRADVDQPMAELKLESNTFESAIDTLRNMTKSNIMVYWDDLTDAGIERITPVRLHLWNTTLGNALGVLIASVNGRSKITYDVRDNMIRIGSTERLFNDGGQSVRLYDIRDIIEEMMAFHDEHGHPQTRPATSVQMSNGTGAFTDALTMQEATDQIVRTIEDNVFPDTWKENGGAAGMIHPLAGRLVITQAREGHRKIVILLRGLRSGGSKEGTELFKR